MPLARDLSNVRRRQGRKKDEALRIVVPRTKTSSKWPSDAEVASVKPVKWTKNVAPSLAVSPAVARVSTGASGCKGVANCVKKVAVLVQKCHVPSSRMLAEASSVESNESSSHDPLPRDSLLEVVSRPKREASLQITPTTDVSGALISSVVVAAATS
jgi:hypothetical protein